MGKLASVALPPLQTPTPGAPRVELIQLVSGALLILPTALKQHLKALEGVAVAGVLGGSETDPQLRLASSQLLALLPRATG